MCAASERSSVSNTGNAGATVEVLGAGVPASVWTQRHATATGILGMSCIVADWYPITLLAAFVFGRSILPDVLKYDCLRRDVLSSLGQSG